MQHSIAFRILLLTLFLLPTILWSQISTREDPISTQFNLPKSVIPMEVMPPIDPQFLASEDEKDKENGLPPRFGWDFDVNLNLQNSGVWQTLPNGDRLWRLSILAKDALSINFLFDDFWLPKGGKLFIYSKDKKHVIGAFTDLNNKIDRRFGTGLVYGDEVTLEYYEPANLVETGQISISKVVHGYRHINIPDDIKKAFGDSGSCNVNTICNEGNNWRDEIKGVAMILVNGVRNCSGSLIVTTEQDCRPYFLTANHCLSNFDAISNPTASTFSFMWNYESPSCSPSQDGPTNFVTNGATVIANSGNPGNVEGSDFALLQLVENPVDADFDVYFNGFDARNNTFTGVTGIHHPAGDVKKISMENATVTSTNYLNNATGANRTHWRVIDWDSGTTEGGSSGSPLFDNGTKRIIGDLSGGGAACGNDLSDWYGKMFYSWTGNGTTDARRRLHDWLDPVNGGATMFADGREPCITVSFVDAVTVVQEGSSCGTKTVTAELSITSAATGNTTVNLSIDASSTANNEDYSLNTTTVTFPNGSTVNQVVTFTINEDAVTEDAEGIVLNINSVTGSNAVAGFSNQSHTLFITNDDIAPVSGVEGNIVSADFDPETAGFISLNQNTGANFVIATADAGSSDFWTIEDNNSDNIAVLNEDACGQFCTSNPVFLVGPSMDLTLYNSATLTFDHAFADVGDEFAAVGVVTGNSFTTLQELTNTSTDLGGSAYSTPWVTGINVDLSAYLTESNVSIAFVYSDAGTWAYGMALDNIFVSGEHNVQTANNSGNGFKEQDLGPNETAYFYDTNTGNIMLSIENLGTEDYGCTRVEVDRAGNNAAGSWETGKDITQKTFKITPEFDHANGNYRVTLYYTEAEIAGWENTNQASDTRTDLRMIRADGSIMAGTTNTFEDKAVTATSFDTDLSYAATFTGGFENTSGFGLGNNAKPLPIELLVFDAAAAVETIELDWTTSRELNNAGFYLQRSIDGKNFSNLAWVTSANTTINQESHYTFVDKKVKAGITYFYRLAQIDLDGTKSYSLIRSAILDAQTTVKTSPNPVQDVLNLNIATKNNWLGTVYIYDLLGRVWYEQTVDLEGVMNQEIDMSTLPKGIYWLRIDNGSTPIHTEKLVKL